MKLGRVNLRGVEWEGCGIEGWRLRGGVKLEDSCDPIKERHMEG